jgi:hypothetical protein
MENFSIIHIFTYGETQMIGTNYNVKVTTSNLTKVEAFIDYVKSLRPGGLMETNFRIITVFNNSSVRFVSDESSIGFGKDRVSFDYKIEWADLDLSTLEELVAELNTKIETE